MIIKNIAGQRFGRLLVLYYSHVYKDRTMWMCKCDCGTLKLVPASYLKSGKTKSCRCYRRERRSLPKGEATVNSLISEYQKHAQHLGVEFSLNREQFKSLIFSNCSYCGSEPKNFYNHQNHKKSFLYNGIDRIDSSKGYYSENVVPCCKYCNVAKQRMSVQQFIGWITKLSKSPFVLLQRFGGSHCTPVEVVVV